MTMKITTILTDLNLDGISYSPGQRVAFCDDAEADGLVLAEAAALTPDATGFTDHDSRRAAWGSHA
jgi:hypothetical protein